MLYSENKQKLQEIALYMMRLCSSLMFFLPGQHNYMPCCNLTVNLNRIQLTVATVSHVKIMTALNLTLILIDHLIFINKA